MARVEATHTPSVLRLAIAGIFAAFGAALLLALVRDPLLARASVVAWVCLTLWLSEAVPAHVPTLVLWGLTPLLLLTHGEAFSLPSVLRWSADPVLAVFFGGFVISAAARRHGLDAWIAQLSLRFSGGRRLPLLIIVSCVTAFLSMWMSNVAATAMMIVAIHPLASSLPLGDPFRRALLLGIAMGANFGGIATPIGTGPNAIAISAATSAAQHSISFVGWMAFALPVAALLLASALLFIRFRYTIGGRSDFSLPHQGSLTRPARWVITVIVATIVCWLAEPLHGISAPLIALLSAALFFTTGLLDRHDLSRIDWSTLLLIAGGIGLGHLLQESGLLKLASSSIPWDSVSPFVRLLGFTFFCAALASVMSNTATATVLIPLVASLDPSPATLVLVALAASLGIPFVISTPPNAMVYGEGGLKTSDLLVPGLALMILGWLTLCLVGPAYLRFMGFP